MKEKDTMEQDQSQIKGYVHSIESMGLVDGPGIRLIIFLQGCPIRCAYCHNPDSQALHNPENQIMTPGDILDLALRQKTYFGQEGGVTFSGGEPLLQGDFLLASMQLLHDNGINVAVDTSGFGDRKHLDEILALTDTLLLDVKAFTAEKFKSLTGGSFPVYQEFLSRIKQSDFQGQIWVRHVMVPGYTDNERAMNDLVATIMPLAYRIDRIEILPYHVMGVDKYKQMGIPYRLEGVPAMDPDKAKRLERYANRHFTQVLHEQAEGHKAVDVLAKQILRKDTMGKEFQATTIEPSIYIQEGIDLRTLPLLRHLSVAEFYEMAQDIQVKKFERGDYIFQSGNPADKMFIVCQGQFKIFKNTVDGREQILYIYSPGDFVGGLNLLKDHRYLYTGQALEACKICTMSKALFDRVCLYNPQILRQILEKSYDRIRWAEDLITRLSSANAGIKTAGLLLRFAELDGTKTEDGIRIELNMNREELGSYAGLTRETFTRKIGEFKDLGYLDFTGNRVITIKDEAALREYIGI